MKRVRLHRRAGFLAAGLALVLAPGCVQLLPEQDPATIYRLAPSLPEADPVAAQRGAVILVERPEAPRALAGDRIAMAREQGQIAYIAGANWISPAPDLIQELILDTFDRQLEGYTAARAVDGVDARYVVRLELRHFEAVYDRGNNRAPLARVGLRARLVDDETHDFVAVTTLRGEARAEAHRQGAIVEAFSEAAREAAQDLADWTETQLAEAGEPS